MENTILVDVSCLFGVFDSEDGGSKSLQTTANLYQIICKYISEESIFHLLSYSQTVAVEPYPEPVEASP
jgi:hypothetical protein